MAGARGEETGGVFPRQRVRGLGLGYGEMGVGVFALENQSRKHQVKLEGLEDEGLGQRSPEGPPRSQPSGAMSFSRTFCHDGKFLHLCHVEQIASWA